MAFKSKFKTTTASTTLTVTVSGISAHDTLVMYMVSDNPSATTVTWPAGFDPTLAQQITTFDGQTLTCAIKKDCTGSEGALATSNTSGMSFIGGVLAFSGRDNTTPTDFVVSITNSNTNLGNPGVLNSSSRTPGNNDCDLVGICGWDAASLSGSGNVTTFSTTAGTTAGWVQEDDVTDGNFMNATSGYANQVTAGALTARASNVQGVGTSQQGGAFFLIGLKAAGGAADVLMAQVMM